MTTTYDPATAARLIAEAREVTGAWMRVSGSAVLMPCTSMADLPATGRSWRQTARIAWPTAWGVARARNNLRAMADQLEVAAAEIDRWRARLGVVGDREPRITLPSTCSNASRSLRSPWPSSAPRASDSVRPGGSGKTGGESRGRSRS